MGAEGGATSRLLVAEDDADLQYILKLVLEEEGYQIVTASSLEEALGLVNEQHFALILTDLFAKMPHNPLGSAQILKQHAPATPVAVMTGWRLSVEEIERQGFRFLVPKPFDLDELLALVANALRSPVTIDPPC